VKFETKGARDRDCSVFGGHRFRRGVGRPLPRDVVAARLGVSEFTIKRHVSNLLAKLDLPSRAAAAQAGRQGLA
jgi:hypothetical protein